MPDEKQIRIKPIIALLCDDVRQESNGKPFILGIYTAGITIQESNLKAIMPSGAKAILPLALWVAYEAKEAGTAEVEFQIIAPNPERKLLINAAIEISKTPPSYEILTLSFGGLMLPIEKAGDIKVLFKHQSESEWKILRTIPVTISPTESPPATLNITSSETGQPS